MKSYDTDYYQRVTRGLQEAAAASRRETDPEAALSHLTRIACKVLGDPDSGKHPGALKPGERDIRASGIFFATPGREHLILFAEHGFPAEQRHLRISIMDSRPGHTVRTGEPVVLPNTDEDRQFRQILKTARMGSALYAPIVWRSEIIGMFNVAAQARNTYDASDLEMAMLFANLAAATWIAGNGPSYLAGVASALPPVTREN
jgi:GAF domain-containing protein